MSIGLALVTGGSTGIGRHLVGQLCEAGYHVVFSYIGDSKLANETVSRLSAEGHKVAAALCDAGAKSEVEHFVDQATTWYGHAPSLLINNAGIQTWSTLLSLEEEHWDNVLRTNLKGTFLNTQAVAKIMIAHQQEGAIINIGSGCNKLAFPGLVDYTASKGGVEQLTKISAAELGCHGITVNCVAPGAITTERTVMESRDYEASWAEITPMRRIGTPQDVADAVLFFAGPTARFITGQTLWVDGGVFSVATWPR